MGKRIRHPKKKIEVKENKEKTHFVLDVHNSTVGGKTKLGK